MTARLLVLDIDGTITDRQRKLNLRAAEAMRKAEERGLKICLASGNVLPFVDAVATMIGISGPLIAEDGGVLLINKKMRLLGGREEVDRALEVLKRELGVVETRSSPFRLAGGAIERTVSVEDVRKTLILHGFNLAVVDSGFAIHIKEPHVNKGNALRAVAESLGIPLEEIVAVADGPNDIELLKTAGKSFAVADSPDDVKRICTGVTNSPDGDGVIEVIEAILAGLL
ncbi:MAG: phosphoglycolate phosphatase [Candidatus Hadarchaeales archaeon]